jgi:hypothetical protein
MKRRAKKSKTKELANILGDVEKFALHYRSIDQATGVPGEPGLAGMSPEGEA